LQRLDFPTPEFPKTPTFGVYERIRVIFLLIS